MKKLFIICVLMMLGIISFAQNTEIRRCTEQEIPMSARQEYVTQARNFIHNYYSQLPLNVGELMIQQVFVQSNMEAESRRYKPEFLLSVGSDTEFLSPDQYMMQLDGQFRDFDHDKLKFEVNNVTISDRDFFLPNLISCYIIAEYDLTLTYEGKQYYKRRCRAYCLFPRVSVSILVRMMQVEPIRDIIAYRPTELPVTPKAHNSIAILEREWEKANKYYNEGQYYLSLPIFKDLAEQGYPKGYNSLGLSYHFGRGVEQDLSAAFKYYKMAAEKGFVEAYAKVGYAFEHGRGVEKNLREAYEWYSKSADAGNSVGQYNLGVLYELGLYLKKNLGSARYWYNLSAKQGNKEAAQALERLDNEASSITQVNQETTLKECKGSVKTWNKKEKRYEPLIGTSITVKGTTNGTISDFDGNFWLPNVKKGDMLVFGFVGYKTAKVTWDGVSSVDVIMKEK